MVVKGYGFVVKLKVRIKLEFLSFCRKLFDGGNELEVYVVIEEGCLLKYVEERGFGEMDDGVRKVMVNLL